MNRLIPFLALVSVACLAYAEPVKLLCKPFTSSGKSYTFGTVKAAQARGDFEVLADRGRRALRVHLGADVGAGLAALRDMVRAALA